MSRPDCELYTPGVGTHPGVRSAPVESRNFSEEGWSQPALVWDAANAISMSLFLRVPVMEKTDLEVLSRRGTSAVLADNRTTPAHVPVALARPPAEVRSRPLSATTEQTLRECLSQFDLSNNYFSANARGGTLLPRDAPLEEGSEYWLVTQSPPDGEAPDGVEIVSRAQQLSWTAIRLRITPFEPGSWRSDIRERYLSRRVTPSRPPLTLLWPRPLWHKADGTIVLPKSGTRLIIRSGDGSPSVTSWPARTDIATSMVGPDLYAVSLSDGHAILEIRSNAKRMIRAAFSSASSPPSSIWLSSAKGRARLEDQLASEQVASTFPVDIEIPHWALRHSIYCSLHGVPTKPSTRIELGITHFACGSFGSVSFARPLLTEHDNKERDWTRSLPPWLLGGLPRSAQVKLSRAESIREIHLWAMNHSRVEYTTVLIEAFRRTKERAVS